MSQGGTSRQSTRRVPRRPFTPRDRMREPATSTSCHSQARSSATRAVMGVTKVGSTSAKCGRENVDARPNDHRLCPGSAPEYIRAAGLLTLRAPVSPLRALRVAPPSPRPPPNSARRRLD